VYGTIIILDLPQIQEHQSFRWNELIQFVIFLPTNYSYGIKNIEIVPAISLIELQYSCGIKNMEIVLAISVM